jgi:AGZA family xanthine/uracil permease-like MFS transporter
MRRTLEQYFEFSYLGTSWRTEALAGLTTFLTMAYIIVVNPAILSASGMPASAVMVATCGSAGLASIFMGVFARYPIALASGMGLNAYFAYVVCQGMRIPWQTALGAVFVSGVIFLALTLLGVRERLFTAIPGELYSSIAAGIGLFIAFIGLRNAGLIAADPVTFVKLGDLHKAGPLLSLCGLVTMAVLRSWGWNSAVPLGIAVTALVAVLTGQGGSAPVQTDWEAFTGTVLALDVKGALRIGVTEVVFVFLFVHLFDNLGTLVAVTKQAGLIGADGRIPRANRILLSDAAATMAGAALGTSPVVSYIESSAGIAAGGRSGVTAIVTGLLFLIALPLAPLAAVIPTAAIAPALILVGSEMAGSVAAIRWREPAVAIPSFLTMIAIPLTFSIANGLAIGFCLYTLIQVGRGAAKEISWIVYVLTALFLLRFIYLGAA